MKKTFTVWLTTLILCAAGFLPGPAYAWQPFPNALVDAMEKMKECGLFLAKNEPERATGAADTIEEIRVEMDAMSAEMQKSYPRKRLNRISCHNYAKIIRYEMDVEKAKLLWKSCHEQYRLWIPAE